MSLVWMGSYDGGTLMPAEEARVSPFDHGFTVADGVFETMKVVDGQAFALTRHLARLGTSCAGLGLPHPNYAIIREAVDAVLSSSDRVPLARLRITVTGGDGPLGSDRGTAPATVFVAASPISPWPATTTVVTVPWPRNERSALAGVKSTSYAENVHALAHAHGLGASEAIFGNTVTAWSWFGVNMLGVGLHSYGFMDSAMWWLIAFVASQLAIIGIAVLPLEKWKSFRSTAA